MDQTPPPEKEQPEIDNELESLSADERAAFEKIMAEISASAGGPPPDESPKQSAPPPPSAPEDSPPSPADHSSAPNASPEENPPEEQQASIDKIMAEIETRKKGSQAEAPAAPEEDPSPEEDLSNDQQAALDQIMAEIEAKRNGDKAKTLNAEITEKPKVEEGLSEEELSNDQQAALEQIMAEIEAKRKGEKPTSPQTPEAEPSPEIPSVAQEADLNQIMADIEARKKHQQSEPKATPAVTEVNQSQTNADAEALQPEGEPLPKNENLTLEEFDDELNQLLMTAQQTTTAAEPPQSRLALNSGPGSAAPPAGADRKNLAKEKNASQEKSSPGMQPPAPADQHRPLPILQEVAVEPSKTPKEKRRKKAAGHLKTYRSAKIFIRLGLAVLFVVAAGTIIRIYHQPISTWIIQTLHNSPAEHPPEQTPLVAAAAPINAVPQPTENSVPTSEPVSETSLPANPPDPVSFEDLKADLVEAGKQVQEKIADFQQLKSYYRRGVDEEIEKIEDLLQSGKIPSFEEAIAVKKIELGLRAIQRRELYMAKLETPLRQLGTMGEELLFLERQAQIYITLNKGIIGLPLETFKLEAATAIGNFGRYKAQFSIDQVEAQPSTLPVIWEMIAAQISKQADLLAQRAPLNRSIGAEVCRGNYDRKYLLTAISAQTAQCLINWNGKDLYLNALSELTPEVARILSQWPGEWLSLNGIRELSAEAAKYLSQWPGKRLSLNGITALSAETTAYLSHWHGQQLEMVGLQSIGPWENYGTRLFLSEKLRRQLEAQ